MHIVALFNLKGGVGKTSTAINLAWAAAADGCRTLLWDLDAQGGASYILRRKPLKQGVTRAFRKGTPLAKLVRDTLYERLALIPASPANRKLDILLDRHGAKRKLLSKLVAPLAEDYDVLVLDCPPSLSALAEQILLASDLIVTPVVPAPLSANAFEAVASHLDAHEISRKKLRPVFNLVDRRRTLHRQWITRPPKGFGRRFETVLPAAAVVEQMSLRREPLGEFAPRAPASEAFQRLWIEVLESLQTKCC
ncbi:MAG: ParA family protein [Pseudomonadota bacterium]